MSSPVKFGVFPIFRLAVFEYLVTLHRHDSKGNAAEQSLKLLLTLDKQSFREGALLLYPSIELDDFPWDSPSDVSSWCKRA